MSAPTATGLVATTRRIEDDVDLLHVAGDDGWVIEREGAGFAACGVALTVPADPEVVGATLGAIGRDDDTGLSGTGPVALGALPFTDAAGATLVVPEVVVGRAVDGTAWVTTVTDGRVSTSDVVPDTRPLPADPDEFDLRPAVSHAGFREQVEAAGRLIAAGELRKVVLARRVRVVANRPIVRRRVLERLRALYPSCTVFAAGGFVGASPELLVERRGEAVTSHPLAGTVAHSGDPQVDARLAAQLLASPKERAEHHHVVEAVAAALADRCTRLDVPDAPAIVSLRNVAHLGTRITGTLASPAPSALALALLLHPTPAVAGTPSDDALRAITSIEGADRGRYAGPVGWVDAAGDGRWVVGIRSAEIDGPVADLWAGVGVVAGSDSSAELAETQLKLQALLAAVVRP